MMAQVLNDQIAKRLDCTEGKHHQIFWDEKLKGFGLRVTAKGARSWIVDYRCNGKQRRYTLGSTDTWGCGAARDEAREILRDASRGIDRMNERNSRRDAPTLRDLWEKYEQDELPRMVKRAQADVRTMWQRDVLPEIGSKKLEDVSREDIGRIHAKVTKSGRPVRANRILGNMCRVFNLAIDWGWIEKNPTERIRRNREDPRERYLTNDEIGRLHRALNNCVERTCAEAIQTILLTGARKSEVLQMRWDQLDLNNGVWMKPATMTKQRRTHRAILNGPVIALLKKRQLETTGEYVFPGRTGKPLTKVRQTWLAACREAGLMKDGKPTLTLHDLRHSYASILAASGFNLKIIGDLLGHSNPTTTNRYAHLIDEVQRTAADRVGEIIESSSNGEKADVVPINRQ